MAAGSGEVSEELSRAALVVSYAPHLGLQNAEYQHMSKRKRALDMPLREIAGLRISTGVISSARVEKTQDKRDYKIIIEKRSVRTIGGTVDQPSAAQVPEPKSAEHESARMIEEQADSLVRYFHKAFHSVADHRPQSKEMSQAVSLVATLGYEKARFVVDFSREEAGRTKYQPRTFGGIMHYQSRAAAHYDRVFSRKERERQRQEEHERNDRVQDAYDSYAGRAIDAYLADPKHEAEVAALLRDRSAEATRGCAPMHGNGGPITR